MPPSTSPKGVPKEHFVVTGPQTSWYSRAYHVPCLLIRRWTRESTRGGGLLLRCRDTMSGRLRHDVLPSVHQIDSSLDVRCRER